MSSQHIEVKQLLPVSGKWYAVYFIKDDPEHPFFLSPVVMWALIRSTYEEPKNGERYSDIPENEWDDQVIGIEFQADGGVFPIEHPEDVSNFIGYLPEGGNPQELAENSYKYTEIMKHNQGAQTHV